MFDDNNQNNTNTTGQTDMDQVAQEIGPQAAQQSPQDIGLGVNPSAGTAPSQPQQNLGQPAPPPPPASDTPTDDTQAAHVHGDSELDKIKNQVIDDLSPLVNKIDQTAEERFKTIMMMIQASDNRSLIQGAYEAAKAIEDEKVRAEALLTIVNEINYFTQKSES